MPTKMLVFEDDDDEIINSSSELTSLNNDHPSQRPRKKFMDQFIAPNP